jgi:hypothetical protein
MEYIRYTPKWPINTFFRDNPIQWITNHWNFGPE